MSMNEADWTAFLQSYSAELASREERLNWAEVPQEARDKRWLGYPPATDDQIEATESRLGITLPEDVRAFYRISNGWMLCDNSIYDLRPLEDWCWLREGDPDLWELCQSDEFAIEDDDDYGHEQGTKVCRSLLLNTRGDDASMLYDPFAQEDDLKLCFGTWASWNPAMEWTATTLSEYFVNEREITNQVDSA